MQSNHIKIGGYTVGNSLSAIALFTAVYQITPDNAFHPSVKLHTLTLIAPVFVLWLSMLTMTILQAKQFWLFLVIGSIIASFFVIGGL